MARSRVPITVFAWVGALGLACAPAAGGDGSASPVAVEGSEQPGGTPQLAPSAVTKPLQSTPPQRAATSADASGAPSAPAGSGEGTAAPASRFPPPPVQPPFPRSAKPGDGEWQALDPAGLVVRTVIHPHEVSRFHTVTIAAIDLSRSTLHWLPGTGDVEPKKVPTGVPVGSIPEGQRERVVAAFNGGFQPPHGRWGIRIGSLIINPPREQGCTVAITGDQVRIARWPELAHDAERWHVLRQTPPCLLERAVLHPELRAGNERPWGGHKADLKTRRRSAIGQTADGATLFYALGEEVGPRLLAEALRTVGATQAAELDINWNWTRFVVFTSGPDGSRQVRETLVPGMVHQRQSYVVRPSDRDFFYVVSRSAE